MLSVAVLAQKKDAPAKDVSATTVFGLQLGTNLKASSLASATVNLKGDGSSGYLEISNTVYFPPYNATVDSTNKPNDNIIQSWISLDTATTDGQHVYFFGSGRFRVEDKKNPQPVAILVNTVCGNNTLAELPGYKTVIDSLSTNCDINMLSNDLYEANVDSSLRSMTQEVTVRLTNDGIYGTLKRGNIILAGVGFNVFESTSSSAPLIDYSESYPNAILLDSAMPVFGQASLTAAAVILALQSF